MHGAQSGSASASASGTSPMAWRVSTACARTQLPKASTSGRRVACNGKVFTFTAVNSLGSATSNAATLTVTPAVPAGALTATQVVAGYEWSMVLRPDRTVWGWGWLHKVDATVVISNLAGADQRGG